LDPTVSYLVEVKQNLPKNQIGILDRIPSHCHLDNQYILVGMYSTLSPTAKKIYVPQNVNKPDEEIQG